MSVFSMESSVWFGSRQAPSVRAYQLLRQASRLATLSGTGAATYFIYMKSQIGGFSATGPAILSTFRTAPSHDRLKSPARCATFEGYRSDDRVAPQFGCQRGQTH